MEKNKTNIKQQKMEKRELDFETCPIHNFKYPKGAECPKCKSGKD